MTYGVLTITKVTVQSIFRLQTTGCDGLTERLSSFVDALLQPISKAQTSYCKDTTGLI